MAKNREIWKDVVGYEGAYKVSNLGNVKSFKYNQKKLSSLSNVNGYLRVVLTINKKSTNISAHRLVALAFIPNIENKPVVNHLNGIRNDNRVENLEWCTQRDNIIHAIKTGLNKMGKVANLTKKQEQEIRKLNKTHFKNEIAEIYNISIYKVNKIIGNKILNK